MVTVTGVAVSPDLGEARVFVSVLGNEKKRAATLAGLESARGVLQAKINRELSLRRTPTLTFAYDDVGRAGRAHDEADRRARRRTCRRRPRMRMTRVKRAGTDRATGELKTVADAIRAHDRFVVVTHENPDGDALGSMLGLALGLRALGKDVVMYLSGTAPTAGRVPLPRSRRGRARAARRHRRARARSRSTARTSGGSGRTGRAIDRAQVVIDVDHHHDNSRFGDVNLIVADASSTAEIVRDMLRELDVDADARDRRGALRRSRHRHGALPVHQHDAEGAAAGRRARRGGRRRARHLPARLRDRAVREAEAARARPRARAAVRGRPARRLVPAEGRLRRCRRGGAVLGGDHRLAARGRGLGDGRADPRAAARTRGRHGASRCARATTRSTSRRSRARSGAAATGRPRGSRPSGRSARSSSSSAASSRWWRTVPIPRALRPVGIALVDKPAGPSSFAIVAALRRRTRARTGHAGTLDPFATGLLVLLSGAATRLAPCFVGLDKRYVTDVDLTSTTTTGDPEGRGRRAAPGAAAVRAGRGARAPPR